MQIQHILLATLDVANLPRPVSHWSEGLGSPYDRPDFANLFAPKSVDDDCLGCDECESCDQLMTPRAALHLHDAAHYLADSTVDALDMVEHDELGDELEGLLPPPVIRRLEARSEADAAAWLAKYVAAYRGIARRLESGQLPLPRCTAEEMALHNVIGLARDFYVDGISDGKDGELADDDDLVERFNLLSEALFEDEDVLMLFDPAMDGIEDSELGRSIGAANLHTDDWFSPFCEADADGLSALFGVAAPN